MTRVTILLCLQANILLANSAEKEFQLVGLDDGVIYTIVFDEELSKDVATFSLGSSQKIVHGVRGLELTLIHSKKFLEARFTARGGSNVAVRDLVLLCVFEGKLFLCLSMQADVVSRINKVYDRRADSLQLFDEKTDYHITLNLRENGDRFSLNLTQKRTISSKLNPEENEQFEKVYELLFDPVGNFFYNSIRDFNRNFEVYFIKDNSISTVFVGNNRPCIELKDAYYVLVDDMWCISKDGRGLLCR